MSFIRLLRSLWERWIELTGYVGSFHSRLFITVIYFTVAAPFGMVSRLFGDRLKLGRTPSASAWVARPEPDESLEAARRQF